MVTICNCLEVKYRVKYVEYIRDGVRKNFKSLYDYVPHGPCIEIIKVIVGHV
jgi:hypothetical protein